ncbi:MAG TPA: penicillin-binding transpeptidase domain-containing protein, partial [Steroidobacteraceae bacterium]|nr:penicillin-binding transpeptidase domain-containing protein [Steroidobacteraceae bacterium]
GQVTPLEMARGFTVFANGGFLVTPYIIEEIRDAAGQTVFKAAPALACPECALAASVPPEGSPAPAAANAAALPAPERRAPQVISAANAYVMTDMMTDVIQRGTAVRARVLGRTDIAGKTGTTSDRRDTWFCGFNADIAAAVWIGFDQERSLGENEEGGHTALPMWIYFMQEALHGKPPHRQPEPPGVVRMWVSRETGQPSRAGAPDALFEVFLEQFTPQTGLINYSDEVRAETVQPQSGDDSLF